MMERQMHRKSYKKKRMKWKNTLPRPLLFRRLRILKRFWKLEINWKGLVNCSFYSIWIQNIRTRCFWAGSWVIIERAMCLIWDGPMETACGEGNPYKSRYSPNECFQHIIMNVKVRLCFFFLSTMLDLYMYVIATN